MGSWSQVWQAFAAAVLSQPPMIAIVIASGSVLILVLAVEGFLVSFFPHHVARRMRVLPSSPSVEDEIAPARVQKQGGDLRLEPGFAAPMTDLRSSQAHLTVVRDMRDIAPEN